MKYMTIFTLIALMATSAIARTQVLKCEDRRSGETTINLTTGQAEIFLFCWEIGCMGGGHLESIHINEDYSTTYVLSINLYNDSQVENVLLNVKPNGDAIISIKNLPMKCQIVTN